MDDPCWLLDLDGVVWLGGQAIPGGAEAVRLLREADRRVAFFTNNSSPTHAEQVAKLAAFGLEPVPADVLTSAQAAARLCAGARRALVLGGSGIVEALAELGVEAVPAGSLGPRGRAAAEVDAVVVGLDPALTYDRLADAVSCVLAGARLVGTNEDPTFPTPDGALPGAGSMLAAVACAAATAPVVAGKPHQPAADLVAERLGTVSTVVGDRPSTDGALARRLGARFALVHSGVTPAGHGPTEPPADLEAADLLALAQSLGRGDPADPGRGRFGGTLG